MTLEEIQQEINDWSIENLEELADYLDSFIESLKSESGGRDV